MSSAICKNIVTAHLDKNSRSDPFPVVGDGAEAIPGLKTESSNCLPPLLERIFISLSPLNSDTSRRHPVSKNQQSRHEKNQPPPDTFSVSPVSKGINQNEERPTMDINDLFDLNHEKYQPVCRRDRRAAVAGKNAGNRTRSGEWG